MVGNNKVLTVSYGTFSCTLEGFEDSFDTMKAIAEYFRDLAAEDRYFGAEPPQPDAEVMARIAEREVARNVQARTEGGRVLLQTTPTAEPAAQDSSVETSAASETVTSETVTSESDHEADNAAVVEPAEEVTTSPAASEDAAQNNTEAADEKLDEKPVAETVDEPEEPAVDEVAADAEPMSEEDQKAAERAAVRARRQARRAAKAQAAAEAEAAAAAEAEAEAEAKVEMDANEAAPEVDVVKEADAEPEIIEVEDNGESAVADDAADLTADAEDALQAALANAEEAELEAELEPEPERDEGESLTAKLRRIQAVVGTAAVAGGSAVATKAAAQDDVAEFSEDEHAEDFTEAAAATNADAESSEIEGQTAPAIRVLKMKKKDFEAAVADGEIAAVEDAGDDQDSEEGSIFADLDGLDELSDVADEADVDSSLSQEDEADLARELAELTDDTDETPETPIASEDDDAFEDIGEAVDQIVDEAVETGPAGREVLEQQAETGESSVNRLLEKTEEAMDEPGSRTRRNAISHLKAAVAATVADRKVGAAPAKNGEDDQPYREDLARVVRPRRPEKRADAETAEAAPKADARPKVAPLKLVASQRVDAPAPEAAAPKEPAQPVRPRRVAAQPAPEASSPEFAAFAGQVNAEDIPDMLEAAAAYTTYVDGNDVFSRPQVMRLVQGALPEGGFSREDGLRAFGTLLRQGRLKKIRGGQFEVTADTRFTDAAEAHGEARAAG